VLPGVLYATGSQGRSGSLLPPRPRHFYRVQRYLSDCRPPQAFTCGFILPRAFRLLQSTATTDLPHVPRTALRPSGGRRAPPLEFRPSSRHQPAASTSARNPSPELWSALDVSHVLDGLLRHRPCGFVSPRSHVQGLPFRGLSLPRSRTGFPRPRHALVPLNAPACGVTRSSKRALDFRALLPARMRCRTEAVSSSSVRAPLGLSLLRVLPPRNVGTISGPLRPRP